MRYGVSSNNTPSATLFKYKTVCIMTFFFSYNVLTKEKALFILSVCDILESKEERECHSLKAKKEEKYVMPV
jgi:hypothetical protein